MVGGEQLCVGRSAYEQEQAEHDAREDAPLDHPAGDGPGIADVAGSEGPTHERLGGDRGVIEKAVAAVAVARGMVAGRPAERERGTLAGEEPVDAARRELHEETGIIAAPEQVGR